MQSNRALHTEVLIYVLLPLTGTAMTHIERMRLQAALEALPGAHPRRSFAVAVQLKTPTPLAEEAQVAATE